jgi:outer membrane lipase/esterase
MYCSKKIFGKKKLGMSHHAKDFAGVLAVVAVSLLVGSKPASSQALNQFIGFGDSSIDSGYYRSLASPGGGATFNSFWAAAVAAGAGAPTTSPGLMNSQALAARFGLSALPADQGGSNYATSGAKNVTVNNAQTGGFGAAIPTDTQISDYLAANGGRANANGLYLISSGGNDVSFATGGSGTGPFPSNPQAYLVSAANSLASSVASLQAAGARYIVVPDLPFSFPTGNSAANVTQRADRLLYSQTLWNSLAANGVNFIPADQNAMRLAIASNPALFGLQFIGTGPGQPACTQPAGVTTAWALLCSSNPAAPSHLVTPDADQTHLFADDQHYTTAGQKILADYEYSLLVAPSEISFLAEAPVKTRAAVVDSIFNQIAISERQRKAGTFNVWATGEAMSLAINSGSTGFPNDPGTPAAVTAGIDYAIASNIIVGAAFSYGQTTQSFDLGGDFKQTDIAGSLYGAYAAGPYWARAIGTYGGLTYDVNRIVPIGITQQSNTGNTSGRNVSFAAEFGYDFTMPLGGAAPSAPVMPLKAAAPAPWPLLTFGPVVGIVLQHITVNGYTETDPFAAIGGFTALSFGDQTRNSAVTELGYQASLDLGRWHPFTKLVWNHELASTDRSVTASLTTIVAPSYWMPAVLLGKDWGTATLGTTVTFAPGVTGYGTLTSQIGQQNVIAYGGQVGLNVALR